MYRTRWQLVVIYFLVFISFIGVVQAQEKERTVTITYLSAEYIYLDGGKDSGINAGDTLAVSRQGEKTGRIKIVYVSGHTASGIMLSGSAKPQVGDEAIVNKAVAGSEEAKPEPVPVQTLAVPAPAEEKSASVAARISGNLGLQWYQFLDQSTYHRDYSQPAIRFNLKAGNLWNSSYNLRIRLRSNYYNQAHSIGSYSGQHARQEWRNRLYEISFSYDNPQTPLNFRMGRILANAFSGAGYIDGIMLQHNLNDFYHWGIFAGEQPQWQYSDVRTSLQKYGLYTNYQKGGSSDDFALESSLALVGEYHSAKISREYVYVQTAYNRGSHLSLFQNAEIDINRYWRREKTNQSVSVSSLLFSANVYLNDHISASVSYDHRRNYYTYELRSLADSLFDDALRQGLRSTVYFRIMSDLRISANIGFNRRENDSRQAYSYGMNIIKSNLLFRGSVLSARLAGFSNLFSRGYNPSLLIGKNFNSGHMIDLAYGYYFYKLDINQSSHTNQWLRSTLQLVLLWHLYLYGQYEYDWGDDRQGQLLSVELSYHF